MSIALPGASLSVVRPIARRESDSIDDPRWSWNRPLFQNAYVWLVFLSALDCIMTWLVLHFGGEEVNHLANAIFERWDIAGMVVYKFILICFVIFCCEAVGRRRVRTGWRLAIFAVVTSCVPVTAAFAQLLTHPL